MENKIYTSGELANLSGLTVRTIQHYDNIGLLPSHGRTSGGHRFHTETDLIQIEQILFYKMLDFSLEQIKDALIVNPSKNEQLNMLKTQGHLLLQRMEHFHTAFTTIDQISKMIEIGKTPPFSILIRFLSSLPGDDIFSKAPQIISEANPLLSKHFKNLESAQSFYHSWKGSMIESVLLLNEGVLASNPLAQDMAKRCWNSILLFTNGDQKIMEEIAALDIEVQLNKNNPDMLFSASKLLSDALEMYLKENFNFDT